ncbi:MAG: penicillin-binding protein activator LpoB [Campylobacterota bacterium]|nr:penicillin-binding protein activator LpoB [Campylobacterota bacterium]
MNKKFMTYSLAALTATMLLTGCAKQPQIVGSNGGAKPAMTMGIDRADFQKAASESIDSMLNARVLNKYLARKEAQNGAGWMPILMISDVKNNTTQRIDVDMLIKKIRIALLNDGRFVTTTAARAGGPEDTATRDVRELAKDDLFNKKTVKAKDTATSPDFSLGGKIIQRNAKTGSGDQLAEYYFQLTLTELGTGLALWEGESVIGKMGSNDTVSW